MAWKTKTKKSKKVNTWKTKMKIQSTKVNTWTMKTTMSAFG